MWTNSKSKEENKHVNLSFASVIKYTNTKKGKQIQQTHADTHRHKHDYHKCIVKYKIFIIKYSCCDIRSIYLENNVATSHMLATKAKLTKTVDDDDEDDER